MIYRVAFYWDCRGTNVTEWIRQCVTPELLSPEALLRGFWVREPTKANEKGSWHGDCEWSKPSANAVWIPPSRITSVFWAEQQ